MDRRPPLPVSSSRLRTRFPPPSGPSPSIKSQISLTPRLTGTSKKRKPLNRSSAPLTVSRRSTAARVNSATGDDSIAPTVGSKSPLFERGRLYDLYSARRNERLERKIVKCSEAAAAAVTEDPAVAVELAKRRLSKKADQSARKSVLAHFSGSRGSSSRSSAAVGSSKEKRKAGFSSAASSECSAAGGGRRNGSGSVRWL